MGKHVWSEEDEQRFRSGVREFYEKYCSLTDIDSYPGSDLFYIAFTSKTFFEGKTVDIHTYNQRLEFLGDSVSKIYVKEYLYNHYPNYKEGKLAAIETILDDNAVIPLFLKASSIDLEPIMKHGKGVDDEIKKGSTKFLADCFEAILGALYLNNKIGNANLFCYKVLVEGKSRFYDHFDTFPDKGFVSKSQELNKNINEIKKLLNLND